MATQYHEENAGHAPCTSIPTSENVVNDFIEHPDPPTEIDEHEAAQFANVQHAGFIERSLNTKPDMLAGYSDDGTEDALILCKLNRNTKQVRSELSSGSSLNQCRQALEAQGFLWKHFSGAFVFVHPSQYHMAMNALKHIDLKADHIVFTESLEYLVEEALARCKGAWMKLRNGLPSSSSEIATLGREQAEPLRRWLGSGEHLGWLEHAEILVRRTFITLVPRRHNTDDASTVESTCESAVTKSTTDAHARSCTNHRYRR